MDSAVVEEGRRDLQEELEDYRSDNVHNMDESGLCYSMAPTQGICARGTKGGMRDKTRVTIGPTHNASGTSKLPPLFIVRARKPRCVGRKSGHQLGFDYANNTNVWMTGNLYTYMG